MEFNREKGFYNMSFTDKITMMLYNSFHKGKKYRVL